jgi:hypothetical protein
VQFVEIRGNEQAFGVVPRALSDPVARVHRRLTIAWRRTQVRPPRMIARTFGFGERGAMRISASQTAEVSTFAGIGTGDEERHH